VSFWLIFWMFVLAAGLAVFAVLAVVVAIGAFFDVRAMFRSIERQHEETRRHLP
jgi:hypothetical protein